MISCTLLLPASFRIRLTIACGSDSSLNLSKWGSNWGVLGLSYIKVFSLTKLFTNIADLKVGSIHWLNWSTVSEAFPFVTWFRWSTSVGCIHVLRFRLLCVVQVIDVLVVILAASCCFYISVVVFIFLLEVITTATLVIFTNETVRFSEGIRRWSNWLQHLTWTVRRVKPSLARQCDWQNTSGKLQLSEARCWGLIETKLQS